MRPSGARAALGGGRRLLSPYTCPPGMEHALPYVSSSVVASTHKLTSPLPPSHAARIRTQCWPPMPQVLTELSVADDATLPACQHTRDKLVRCFGRLLPAGRGGEGPKGGAGAGLLGCMGGPGMKLGAQRGSGGGRGKGMVR